MFNLGNLKAGRAKRKTPEDRLEKRRCYFEKEKKTRRKNTGTVRSYCFENPVNWYQLLSTSEGNEIVKMYWAASERGSKLNHVRKLLTIETR